ncbi:MAG TPA: hypothetical protein P5219_11450 [Aminivibrio sp.]|nr:hypothetical protein [Aminivibrio sp.]
MTPTAKARLKAFIAVVAWGGSLPSIKAAVAEVSFTVRRRGRRDLAGADGSGPGPRWGDRNDRTGRG